ncbi:YceI family protein [Caulobacter sp. 602-1]|uniref:YceI family protein n=1 Tax=unclassified Caulobacter TaxID=2648921 RepID=UPI000F64343E|nr:YceI family protein [Caulobacter sp. 602-1]RRN62118.1 polyisoprenoid-binding protein [Caulobacter sp. 602-1]
MRSILPVMALLALAACSPQPAADKKADAPVVAAPPAAALKPPKADIPAGDYTLDKHHATLVFSVSHLGFSNYTAAFADFDAKLHFDQNNPAASTLEATINPMSLTIPAPPEGFLAELTGAQWLNTATYPTITFKSTKVETTGPDTGKVTGDLTLHGVTKPVVLDVTYNGGYPGHPMDPHARVGFSAKGAFNRSDFGIAYGVPAPGTTMGVGDEVQVMIEAEFSGPPLATAPAGAAAPKP